MACGAKFERLEKDTALVSSNNNTTTTSSKSSSTSSASFVAATGETNIFNSFSNLSAAGLAALCHRLRVQLIHQRLPLICASCRPNLLRAFNMEVNLTQMLRGICVACRSLFKAKEEVKLLDNPSKVPSSPTKSASSLSSHLGFFSPPASPPLSSISSSSSSSEGINMVKKVILKVTTPVKAKSRPTTPVTLLRTDIPIFEAMTEAGIDWCRYCGTTNGVNWRPGPWGQRTLCNKHGCAYHGYGFCKGLARLDLSAYEGETIKDRLRPVVQESCFTCSSVDATNNTDLCRCYGCPKAFHKRCLDQSVMTMPVTDRLPWYCSETCKINISKGNVPSSPLKQRNLSEPAIPTPKRRFAKNLGNILNAPLTPPPSPDAPAIHPRKRRATTADASSSSVLVCFNSDVVVKRACLERKKSVVFTPHFKAISVFPPTSSRRKGGECPSDEDLLTRHARYEEVEKTMRLCRPEVLRTLFKKSDPSQCSIK